MDKRLITFIILIFFSLTLLNGQKLETTVDKSSQLFIGSPFKLNVKISTGINDSIFAPNVDTVDVFQVLEINQNDEVTEDKKTTNVSIKLAGFNTGEYEVPPFKFLVKSNDEYKELETKPFTITIQSVITDSTQAIADINGLLGVSLGLFDYLLPIAIIIIFALFVIWLTRLKQEVKAELPPPVPVDNRPAYVIALELLEILKGKKLLEKGDFLNFHFELSYIVRLFIEKQYKLPAVEMTSREIRKNLQLDDKKEKTSIMNYLEFSDMIKFAKYTPKPEKSSETLRWAENYIKDFEKKQFEKTDEEGRK